MRIIKFCAPWVLGAICMHTNAVELSLLSKAKQTGLLELYSSEGCSSCPPADKWLAALKGNPHLWSEFIPVAFHVDYWDDIGWKDRFASPAHTRRQHRYAREGGSKAVYTPGFFYNGSEWRRWFTSREPDFPPARNSGVLRADLKEEKIEVSFNAIEEISGPVIVNVVLLGFDLLTPVKAGENRGRELRHDFVVLKHEQTRLSNHNNSWTGTARLPGSEINASREGIAIWISASNMQRPLQAVGGWLQNHTED